MTDEVRRCYVEAVNDPDSKCTLIYDNCDTNECDFSSPYVCGCFLTEDEAVAKGYIKENGDE